MLQKASKNKDVALFWSHNKKDHPEWLDSIMKNSPQFVWWDVAWTLKAKPNLPRSGYIWSTVDRPTGVTHKASIVEIDSRPTEQRIQEVIQSWEKFKIRFNENSPLLLYKKKQKSNCTLLKLKNLVELANSGKLADFTLVSTGKPPTRGPQSHYIVFNPYLT
jgi:hypothetical protein